jgi:hypothetical protein
MKVFYSGKIETPELLKEPIVWRLGQFHKRSAVTEGDASSMSDRPETPFDNIESAEQFVRLLIEAIEQSKHDVDADIAQSDGNRSGRSKKALQLISGNLAKLNQHMAHSRRILGHLRTLRRLLLQERRLDNAPQAGIDHRELRRWP